MFSSRHAVGADSNEKAEMKRKHAILRAELPRSAADPFRTALSPHRMSEFAEVLRVCVDVDDLSSRDVGLLGRDRNVLGLAQCMPTKLVEPVTRTGAGGNWGLDAVGATESPWDGSGVRVCILDTGVQREHATFSGIAIEEHNFTQDGLDDTDGHGTHCAGTAFGRNVGGVRVGVARGVRSALLGKILGAHGGDSEMLMRALFWAIESGAKVILLSTGFDFSGLVASESEHMPVKIATSRALEAYRANLALFDIVMDFAEARIPIDGGALLVAPTGNESRKPAIELNVATPAATKGVVSVGAVETGDTGFHIASFSNSLPTIAAPGVGILSASATGGLVAFSGTSAAAAHVAGVAAQWWQALTHQSNAVNAHTVLAKLITSARSQALEAQDDASQCGVGLVRCPGDVTLPPPRMAPKVFRQKCPNCPTNKKRREQKQ